MVLVSKYQNRNPSKETKKTARTEATYCIFFSYTWHVYGTTQNISGNMQLPKDDLSLPQ